MELAKPRREVKNNGTGAQTPVQEQMRRAAAAVAANDFELAIVHYKNALALSAVE